MTDGTPETVYKPVDLTYSPLEPAKMSTFGLLMILVFFSTTIGFAVARLDILFYAIPVFALIYIVVNHIIKEKENTQQYYAFIEYRNELKAYTEAHSRLVFQTEDNDEELTRFAAGEEIYRKSPEGVRYGYSVIVEEETGEVSILRKEAPPVTVEPDKENDYDE